MPVKQSRIVINDFRPGIHADAHAQVMSQTVGKFVDSTNGTANAENGAAVMEHTYRCGADMSGALVPLPKVQSLLLRAMPGGNANVGSRFLANYPYVYTLDAAVMGPAIDFVAGTFDKTWFGTEQIAIAQGWYYQDPAASVVRYRYYQRATMYRGSTSVWSDFWFGYNDNPTIPVSFALMGAASLFPLRSTHTSQPDTTFMHMAFAMSLLPTPYAGAVEAYEAALSDYNVYNAGVPRPKELGIYGDYVNDATNNSSFINTPKSRSVLACSHQGRFVAVYNDYLFNGMGNLVVTTAGNPSSDFIQATLYDRLQYAPFLDPLNIRATMPAAGVRTNSFGDDNVDMTGVLASLSNDELLLIRHRGGGVLVSGDLDNPTVKRLPFIAPTGGAKCHPAYTPIGLAYVTASGVYVWEGGETSRKISNQFDGAMWRMSASLSPMYAGAEGRLAWWDPYIMVPNSFMFDTRTESWWRLEDPDSIEAFSHYAVGPSTNRLFAFPWRQSATRNQICYEGFQNDLAHTYSWKSQPLVETIDTERVISVNDIKLIATPAPPTSVFPNEASTVTVTLSGFGQRGETVPPVSVVFTFPHGTTAERVNHPHVMLKTIPANFRATNVQVRIVADGGVDGGISAPKIHELSLGYRESVSYVKDAT